MDSLNPAEHAKEVMKRVNEGSIKAVGHCMANYRQYTGRGKVTCFQGVEHPLTAVLGIIVSGKSQNHVLVELNEEELEVFAGQINLVRNRIRKEKAKQS